MVKWNLLCLRTTIGGILSIKNHLILQTRRFIPPVYLLVVLEKFMKKRVIEKKIHKYHYHKKHHKTYQHVSLRRDLNLFQATLAGIGVMVGAGIYALIGAASGLAGNAIWISFLIGSIVAVFTGLSYAELSSLFPKDAGEYIYSEHSFGKKIAFFTAYYVIIGAIISAAAVSIGFASYLYNLVGFNVIFAAIGLIILLSLINLTGIKESVTLNIILTILAVLGLFIIISFLPGHFGNINYLIMPHGLFGVFQGASLIFFAFIGFEAVVKLSEETKNPKKNIPLSLILSLVITAVIYILVAISAISVLGWEKLSVSKAPLAEVAAVAFGEKAFLILAIIALLSTSGTVLVILLTTSRMIYGMGHEFKSKLLTKISQKTRTPYAAILTTMLLSILFVFLKDIKTVASITNFTVFTTFIIVNLSVIVLRYKEPNIKRTFKVPLNIGKFPVLALLGILTCLFMIISIDLIAIIWSIGLLILGFIIYEVIRFTDK